jgi:hypothetical protein
MKKELRAVYERAMERTFPVWPELYWMEKTKKKNPVAALLETIARRNRGRVILTAALLIAFFSLPLFSPVATAWLVPFEMSLIIAWWGSTCYTGLAFRETLRISVNTRLSSGKLETVSDWSVFQKKSCGQASANGSPTVTECPY